MGRGARDACISERERLGECGACCSRNKQRERVSVCVWEGRVSKGSCVREHCGLLVTPSGRPPRDTLPNRDQVKTTCGLKWPNLQLLGIILWCLEMRYKNPTDFVQWNPQRPFTQEFVFFLIQLCYFFNCRRYVSNPSVTSLSSKIAAFFSV